MARLDALLKAMVENGASDLFVSAEAQPTFKIHGELRRSNQEPLTRETCKEMLFELMDFFDPATGFRAMERTTGFSAAIVAIMQAHGQIVPGAVPLEKSVPPAVFLAEARKRGLAITERG